MKICLEEGHRMDRSSHQIRGSWNQLLQVLRLFNFLIDLSKIQS